MDNSAGSSSGARTNGEAPSGASSAGSRSAEQVLPEHAKTDRICSLVALQAELARLSYETDLSGLQARLIQGACQVLEAEAGALVLLDEIGRDSFLLSDKTDGDKTVGLIEVTSAEWIVRKAPVWLNSDQSSTSSQAGLTPHPDSAERAPSDVARIDWIYQAIPRHGRGIIQECLRSGKPILVKDASKDPRFDPSSDSLSDLSSDQPVHSVLCVPLLIGDQVTGAIQVLNKRSDKTGGKSDATFDEYDRDLLIMIAALAASDLHEAHLLQQLKVANAELEANRWELLNSRNMLRALFDNLPAALYIVDPDYHIVALNRSRAQRAGQLHETYPTDALVGQVCYQALFNRDHPCPECRVQETFNDGTVTRRSERREAVRPKREQWPAEQVPAEFAPPREEGISEWEIETYPIFDEGGGTGGEIDKRVLQAILLEQDVTEKRHLESILSQSEKLAAIGQLAAGVAHEINNPLTAIIANAQILHRELPPKDDLQVSVDLIARAGARAAQVVRNLLDFARKEDYHLGLTDLNETIQRALDLIQHELTSRGARLSFDPLLNLPPILASQDHLQSVWLNLLLNAIDSLDKSPGLIKITTRQVGDEILVSVTDNGKGIPPEDLTRIFEPFYTTKAAGRGTGLGLSVSHRIIKQHGGHIRVESQVGVGSTFTAVLPTN